MREPVRHTGSMPLIGLLTAAALFAMCLPRPVYADDRADADNWHMRPQQDDDYSAGSRRDNGVAYWRAEPRRARTPIGRCGTGLSSRGATLKRTYDLWEAGLSGSQGYIHRSNINGELANNEPEVAESLVTMYRATGDKRYLLKAATHGLAILSQRDDFTGRKDHTGRSNPIWSNRNARYVSDRRPYGFLAESAWLSYPLAYFAYVVKADRRLGDITHRSGDTLREIAGQFLREIKKTIRHHAPDWHTDTKHEYSIGYYTTPAGFNGAIGLKPGTIEPMNYQSSMGRLFAMLYLATGHEGYLLQARYLAAFLLYDLQYDRKTDGYHWTYWPRTPYYPNDRFASPGTDDLAHGGLSLDFAALMARHRLGLFGRLEMRRFANTFTRRIYKGRPGAFAARVDGSGTAGRRIYHLGRYASLIRFSPRTAEILSETLRRTAKRKLPASTLMLLAIARQLAGDPYLLPGFEFGTGRARMANCS